MSRLRIDRRELAGGLGDAGLFVPIAIAADMSRAPAAITGASSLSAIAAAANAFSGWTGTGTRKYRAVAR